MLAKTRQKSKLTASVVGNLKSTERLFFCMAC